MENTKTAGMPRIYIIGPVNTVRPGSECDQFLNVSRMIEAATDLANLGMNAIVPALCSFWHMMAPQPRGFWIAKNRNDMRACDAAFRIPGESSGGDEDVLYCQELGLQVFDDLERIAEHFKGNDVVDCVAADGIAEYNTTETPAMHPSPVECEHCGGVGHMFETVKGGAHDGNVTRVPCVCNDGYR